jgi:hypothetical protein
MSAANYLGKIACDLRVLCRFASVYSQRGLRCSQSLPGVAGAPSTTASLNDANATQELGPNNSVHQKPLPS